MILCLGDYSLDFWEWDIGGSCLWDSPVSNTAVVMETVLPQFPVKAYLIPGNSYQAMLSRRFDADYVNWGWSGSAKGEPAMAAYIAEQTMSLFMLDLDHNCGTAEELDSVHERFFPTVREKQPDLPILMASRTDPIRDPQMEANEDRRRAVVARTYENALRRGDKQVRFIDGRQVFYAMADRGLSPLGLHRGRLSSQRPGLFLYGQGVWRRYG